MQLQVAENGLPLLEQFSEEGFIDCVLAVQRLRRDATHYYFHMAASFNGEVVGVDVRVVQGVKAGFDRNMELNRDHVYYHGVQFSRSGPESDKLLSAIARLYELKSTPNGMTDAESFTAIALHQDEVDMESQAVKIKIFGNDAESDDEGDYYESFFNLDLPNGLVFWNEKDQEYREPLVRSLSADDA
jgi:hypothetical protein